MVESPPRAVDTRMRSGDCVACRPDAGDVAQAALSPNSACLKLHRYLWLPARYAHPRWLAAIGFTPGPHWRYGDNPPLDRCLNQALQARRGTPRLPVTLSARQRRIATLAPRIDALALAAGLLMQGCHDYFLLPDYRVRLLRRLDDALIWQLFGLCQGKNRAVLSPGQVIKTSLALGSALLHRAARDEPVLHAVLIRLAPCERALWPVLSAPELNLLEQMLCAVSS